MPKFSGESVESGSTEMDSATRNAIFDVLTDKARCHAIEYLATETGSVSVDDLVDFVASAVSMEGTRSRQRMEIRFHHIHLPKMDDAGLLDYDSDERLVTPTETTDAVFQSLIRE